MLYVFFAFLAGFIRSLKGEKDTFSSSDEVETKTSQKVTSNFNTTSRIAACRLVNSIFSFPTKKQGPRSCNKSHNNSGEIEKFCPLPKPIRLHHLQNPPRSHNERKYSYFPFRFEILGPCFGEIF